MCLCCKVETADAVDIIACIISYIMGTDCFEKGCLEGSKHIKAYKFVLRLVAMIIGVGFDLLGLYLSYPEFFSLNNHP